jgi:hypothetical protein
VIILLLLALALHVPDPTLTPGVVRPLSRATVCSTRWGLDRRHVTDAMRREVARRYGIAVSSIHASGRGPCCELDHLVPRELGGADAVGNLWLQPWAEARVKDRRENELHRAACAGTITLTVAQAEMRAWGRP